MTPLVQIDNLRAALAFADYLNTQGVRCLIEKEDDKAHILIFESDDLVAAKQEFARFLEEPAHERYLGASWGQESNTEVRDRVTGEKTTDENIGSYYQNQRASLERLFAKAGWTTKIVALISAIVFVVTGFGTNAPMLNSLFFFSSFDAMLGMEVWRWISPVFVHFLIAGLPLHLIFNVIWWWEFGGTIERFQSAQRLWLVFLIVSVVSNVAQFIDGGNQFGGLSGVVYGLLGYLWFYGRMRPEYPVQLKPELVGFMVFWLVLCFTGFLGPVANAAHLGGLLVGSLLGIVMAKKDQREGR